MSHSSNTGFDVENYLKHIDPTQKYEIKPLTGGNTNNTFRASKVGRSTGSLFPSHDSLIIKYAPSADDEDAAHDDATRYRQTIEARALSLFDPGNGPNLSRVCIESSVSVPKLIRHDQDANVLIISDVGQLISLTDAFSHLEGHSTTLNSDSPHESAQSIDSPSDANASIPYHTAAGRRWGSFFARLHSPRSLSVLHDDPERGPNFLKNPYIQGSAHKQGVMPIQADLKLFPALLSSEEADELFERVEKGNRAQVSAAELTIIIADCWPGSLLFTRFARDQTERDMEVAVVDWEFARTGAGLNNDLAQLLARLALLHTAATYHRDDLSAQQLESLARAIMSSYRQVSVAESTPWTRGSGDVDGPLRRLDPSSVRAKVMRSAFLTHGIEMMRCALGKAWSCRCARCPEDGDHSPHKRHCDLIYAMVERAIWYFRHAKDDEYGFCCEGNQLALQKAWERGQWMLSLF